MKAWLHPLDRKRTSTKLLKREAPSTYQFLCFLRREHMWGLGALLGEFFCLPTPPVFFLPQRVWSSHSLVRECLVHGLLLPHRCSVSQDCSGILLLGKLQARTSFFLSKQPNAAAILGRSARLFPPRREVTGKGRYPSSRRRAKT